MIDTAQRQMFDAVVTDGAPAESILHRTVKLMKPKGLNKHQDLHIFPFAMLSHACETACNFDPLVGVNSVEI